MAYIIQLEKGALDDIKQAVHYYNEQQKGLGNKFIKNLNNAFESLLINPFFQVRYDKVRCLPLNRFPFMIHFVIEENTNIVKVYAVIHTSLSPDKHWMK